jgi:peptidoglycan/LPS O-acetylase OafA/YrhL
MEKRVVGDVVETMHEMKYRADIDGLRACAVTPVILFHAGVPAITGGFVGVDVFFVISGYVISTRLLEDLKLGRFSIIDFYERRVRRIFPALLFVIAVTTVAAAFLLLPPEMIDFSKSLAASAFFASNIYFWKQSGYFDIASTLRPLLHLWSLAVEEQFYILMPVAMYVAYALGSRWRLIFWPALLLSFGLSVAVTNIAASANFFLLPTRAWELLLGAVLVLTPPPAPNRGVAELSSLIGTILLIYGFFFLSEASAFPGANALYPCMGAALLLYAGSSQSPFCNRLISLKPVVFIGLISYSLYLVHWPLMVMGHYYLLRKPRGTEIAILIATSVALAVFSYKFVESPFRRKHVAKLRRSLFTQGAGAMAAALIVGLFGASQGFGWRFPEFKEQAIPGLEQWQPGVCFLDGRQAPSEWSIKSCTLTTGKEASLVLWGDSFAAHYVPGLLRNQTAIPFNIIQYTSAGCPPALNFFSYRIPHCQQFNVGAFDLIDRVTPKIVVLSARWDLLLSRGFWGLQETVNRIASTGAKAIVVGPSPEFGIDVQSLAYRLRNDARASSSWQITNFNPTITNLLERTSEGAWMLDPIGALCRDLICPYKQDQQFLYVDYGHFSTVGSDLAVKTLRLGMPPLTRLGSIP